MIFIILWAKQKQELKLYIRNKIIQDLVGFIYQMVFFVMFIVILDFVIQNYSYYNSKQYLIIS